MTKSANVLGKLYVLSQEDFQQPQPNQNPTHGFLTDNITQKCERVETSHHHECVVLLTQNCVAMPAIRPPTYVSKQEV